MREWFLLHGGEETIRIVGIVIIAYFVILNGGYLLTSIIAFRSLRRYSQRLATLRLFKRWRW